MDSFFTIATSFYNLRLISYVTEGKLTKINFEAIENNQEGQDYSYLDGDYYPPAATHTVTIDGTIQHGTVIATPTDVASGTDVTLTVTPENGYRLKSLSYYTTNPATKTPITGNSFTMPEADVTVTAEFELIPIPEPGCKLPGFIGWIVNSVLRIVRLILGRIALEDLKPVIIGGTIVRIIENIVNR